MKIERSFLALVLASTFACGGDDSDRTTGPMFTTANAEGTGTTDTDTAETGTASASGDGDGDPATGDGDGDPTTSGDGDGDPTTSGDGDGDPTTTGDGDGDGNCETDPDLVGSSCGQGQAYHGSYDIGVVSDSLPVGAIMQADNGIGDGAEDWYQFDFPMGERPNGGTAKVSFVVNDNNDYRFEIYRDCGSPAYGMGLASEFGVDAPPLTEWSFHDILVMEEQVEYIDNTAWPTTVWVRVIRFQNDGQCGSYQLQVERNDGTP